MPLTIDRSTPRIPSDGPFEMPVFRDASLIDQSPALVGSTAPGSTGTLQPHASIDWKGLAKYGLTGLGVGLVGGLLTRPSGDDTQPAAKNPRTRRKPRTRH